MKKPLSDEKLEKFATAYVALELAHPEKLGNGTEAYLAIAPKASKKTAQNQASTWLKLPEVQERIEALQLSDSGADHIVHAGTFIDNLLYKAVAIAEAADDAATLARLGELLDRGREGGPRFIKETRSRKVGENAFTGKTPTEIAAMKVRAREILRTPEPTELHPAVRDTSPSGESTQPDALSAERGQRKRGRAAMGDANRRGRTLQ